MTEYLIILGAICAAVAAWIAVEHIRLSRYQRRLAEKMMRRIAE